jgi:flagellar hook-associated protein 3 FlgL
MRIATSTIYTDQTQSIDSLSAQYQSIGQTLSSGKKLNVPSDDPSIVSQDLTLRNTVNAEDADASNSNAAQNQLTYTDSVLSNLTNVLSEARSLCVEGANAVIPNGTQRPLIGKQVEGLINEAIQLANSQFGNKYIFAGTSTSASQPVVAQGNPPTGVLFSGNNQTPTEVINGQTVTVGTTLQNAFNFGGSANNSVDNNGTAVALNNNGTASVFQVLSTLYQTLTNENAGVQSGQPINKTGQVIYGAASPAPTTLGQLAAPGGPSILQLTPDNAASAPPGTSYYSITINGSSPGSGAPGSATFTFTNATTIDNGTPASVVGQINAQTALTGVQAAWNVASQRLVLTNVTAGAQSFTLADTATPIGAGVPPAAVAATNTSNFLAVFGLPTQVTVEENLSTQLGDIDAATNQVLSARAGLGQSIQNFQTTTNQLQTQSTENTSIQSGYEDTNIASATSQFSLIQTALQGAYATTTRLEGQNLMNYLSGTSTT